MLVYQRVVRGTYSRLMHGCCESFELLMIFVDLHGASVLIGPLIANGEGRSSATDADFQYGSVSKPMESPVVHIKIAGIYGCE